jgi:hypothetical protein
MFYCRHYTICPADNATAGCLGRRRAGQLRFGFVAVLKGHIVYVLNYLFWHYALNKAIYSFIQYRGQHLMERGGEL